MNFAQHETFNFNCETLTSIVSTTQTRAEEVALAGTLVRCKKGNLMSSLDIHSDSSRCSEDIRSNGRRAVGGQKKEVSAITVSIMQHWQNNTNRVSFICFLSIFAAVFSVQSVCPFWPLTLAHQQGPFVPHDCCSLKHFSFLKPFLLPPRDGLDVDVSQRMSS